MKELIGFNMIAFAISIIVIWIIGGDLSRQDRLILSISEPIIMCLLSLGAYFMTGGVI